jgi:DNA-binding NarL/FixJ family response regulator
VGLYDGPIDLAILDLGMPTMSGQEVFPILKRARPGMKIIISSGYDKDDVAQDLLRAGASAFIQKPFPISLFAPKVREVLDRPAQP